ncbi:MULTISPECIES: hypothetical protein [Halorussus]|uniref:hypothetical protein n=1 Tax=Halorussus TaxID=1070314 RepID=UPI00209DDD79|nr:hypothetical protein [Halorussus vallis]USZ76903.1 hypothetical protein NGM07_06130 [Halorussus vallis]
MRVKELSNVDRLTDVDRPTVEVSVRQTGHLSRRTKGHPEEQVAKYVERALDRLDLPYRVVWDLPPVQDVPPTAKGKEAKQRQLKKWSEHIKEGKQPHVRKDSNLLLTDRAGGGISYAGKKAAIAPGGTLTEDADLAEWVTPDDPRHCVYGALHELGHNLHDGGHEHAWGRTWIDEETKSWNRTPMGHGGGGTNLCGEKNDPRKEGYEQRDHLYFADCAREHIQIE